MQMFVKLSASVLASALLIVPMAGYAAKAKTLKVTKSVEIAAPPAEVWAKSKDFDSLHTWHPGFASTEILKGDNNKVGAVRKLTLKDGPNFNEELLSYNDKRRTLKYKIIDPNPLPLTDYVSSFKVKAGKSPNTSVATWQGAMKRKAVDNPKPEENDDAVKKLIAGVYDGGLANLKKMAETK